MTLIERKNNNLLAGEGDEGISEWDTEKKLLHDCVRHHRLDGDGGGGR
jgi:hypothetical protein